MTATQTPQTPERGRAAATQPAKNRNALHRTGAWARRMPLLVTGDAGDRNFGTEGAVSGHAGHTSRRHHLRQHLARNIQQLQKFRIPLA